MNTKITKDNGAAPIPTMQNMEVGQLAQVCHESSTFNGHVVLRAKNGIVSLTDPNTTWTAYVSDNLPSLHVRILPAGAEVTLTQEA